MELRKLNLFATELNLKHVTGAFRYLVRKLSPLNFKQYILPDLHKKDDKMYRTVSSTALPFVG
jgi:hypothetical protein